ncbi:uncharacterized protein PRCAT00004035001 [Priceomyces carsonii]|uniref:uncharacterized protein n=1 Tax=Priceomyces carsonii TaxID=28549 RepID=UPI002ED8F692|nr:unnamed protein product [Priceomyces carsonii]
MKVEGFIFILIFLFSVHIVPVKSLDEVFSLEINDVNKTCSNVNQIPRTDQCQYVLQYCTSPEDVLGKINYMSIYYCGFWPFSVFELALFLGFFFLSLGLTASDYLCPNLYTISKFLQLSDNLAGLTLLAFGNGAPDVLSTYRAMSFNASNLAISELLGASLFITTIIIGSIAILHPIKVPMKPFMRDSGFFLSVTLILCISLVAQSLGVFTYILLTVSYATYVVVVIFSHSFLRIRARKVLRDQRLRTNYDLVENNNQDEDIDEVYMDNFASLPTIDQIRFNINGDNIHTNQILDPEDEIPAEELYDLLRAQTSRFPSNAYGLKELFKELKKHSNTHGAIRLENQRPLTAPVVSQSIQLYQDPSTKSQTFPSNSGPYRDELEEENEELSYEESSSHANNIVNDSEEDQELSYDMGQRMLVDVLDLGDSFYIKLLVPYLINFTENDLFNKCYLVFSTPALILLRLTTPVRDYTIIERFQRRQKQLNGSPFNAGTIADETSREDDADVFDFKFDRILVSVQTAGALNFIGYNLFIDTSHYWILSFPIGIIISLIVSYGVFIGYNFDPFSNEKILRIKSINYFLALLGFISSISWISVLATEIISVLKSISIIFNLSDEILGITVFALGNSVGDLMSNLTIARMGMPLMALGACFGGPLLALCSIGFNGLLLLTRQEKFYIDVELSKTLSITGSALIFNLLILVIIVPRNGWVLDRNIGIILVCNWFFATTICIILELYF